MDELVKKIKYIEDFAPGDQVSDIFVLSNAQQGQAKNGPYWRLVFQDLSGDIEAKIWSPASSDYESFVSGEFYYVRGRVTSYREKNEFSPDFVRKLEDSEVSTLNLSDFVPSSNFLPDEMYAELNDLCQKEINHKPLKRFIQLVLKDPEIQDLFKRAPAAKMMHHAYAGGLLEHTLSVAKLCMKIADHYPDLDRQILMAGAICHDLGKIWELSSGLAVDYTDQGRLIGHINIVLEKIQPMLVKSKLENEYKEHLQHLILSHHGFLEFGSPRLPATKEAFVLHYADNIDAKLQQLENALEAVEDESGWSNYVSGLDRFVFRPLPVPNNKNTQNKSNKNNEVPKNQLSLI